MLTPSSTFNPTYAQNSSKSASSSPYEDMVQVFNGPNDPSGFDFTLVYRDPTEIDSGFDKFFPDSGYLTAHPNPSQRPGQQIRLDTDVKNYSQYASVSPSSTMPSCQGGFSPSPLSSQLHTPNGMHTSACYPGPSSAICSPGGGGGYLYNPSSTVHEQPLVSMREPIILSHPEHDQVLLFKAPAVSQTAQYTFKQQAQFWREALNALTSYPCIPQPMYKPHTDADRRRYVEDVSLEAPIKFNCLHPDELGIPLTDAIAGRFRRLDHKDDTVFEGRGPSVSIRIEWPGYRGWSRQIPTKDFRTPPGPITRAKLAKNVAKCIKRFIEDNQKRALEEDADPSWRVGLQHIKLEDLVLVGLHHVSMGSWQPFIRLNRPVGSRPMNGTRSMLL